MSRPKIPEERKIAEGEFLRKVFAKAKEADPELTQESLSARLGITQGLIPQYFSGSTNIPDSRLIELGQILKFNPYELRPSLVDKYLKNASSGSEKVALIYEALDPISKERAMAYLLGQLEANRNS